VGHGWESALRRVETRTADSGAEHSRAHSGAAQQIRRVEGRRVADLRECVPACLGHASALVVELPAIVDPV
jgi:hypothetical protein